MGGDDGEAGRGQGTAGTEPLQSLTGPATATHHTRLTPNPSLADIPLS